MIDNTAREDLLNWINGNSHPVITDIFEQIKEAKCIDKQLVVHELWPNHVAAYETYKSFGRKVFKEWGI